MSEAQRRSGAEQPDARGPRGVGRLVWWWCACLVAGVGTVCVLAQWGVSATVVFVGLGALVAAVVASSIWSGDFVQGATRKITLTTVAGAVLGPAVAGLVGAFGALGLLIVLILIGTTPALVTWVRTRWFAAGGHPSQQRQPDGAVPIRPAEEQPTAQGQPRTETTPAAEAQSDLGHLDDEALCLAWRRSFVQLEAASSAYERLTLIARRQQYLDELERRSPRGLAAWFASGARASGDPLPYIHGARRPTE
ncbi:hypothetical protein ACFWUU_25065 [Kribbella sp. NPDC058693]|uniref:hypothetical protein n=1 Tax=Kribbella sp. NPDC058693 TaxID=3346602 RepID=UPI003656C347